VRYFIGSRRMSARVRVHFSLAGAAERSVGSGDMVGTTRFLTP
jgi:hypothetical protein